MYICNICGERIPADSIGAIFMQEHLKDKHGQVITKEQRAKVEAWHGSSRSKKLAD